MKTRLIGAAAALVLAVTGTVAVTSYVQGADQRALQGAAIRSIYVVEKEVPTNTAAADLTKYLKTASIPASAIAEGVVTDLGTLTGKVTSAPLLPGEQLLGARMVDPASLLVPGKVPVPDGMQQITVQLSPDRLVGGQLIAGDMVGIYVSFADGAGQSGPTTRLVFQQVLITSVQGAPAEAPAKEGSAPGPPVPGGTMLITLARTAPDAERIVFAAEFGMIWISKEPSSPTESETSTITKGGFYQ